jgi:hypothetical protein
MPEDELESLSAEEWTRKSRESKGGQASEGLQSTPASLALSYIFRVRNPHGVSG